MSVKRLKDLSDPRLDVYCRLTQHQLRNRLEPERGILIAETEKVIRVAVEGGLTPVSLMLEERHLRSLADVLGRISDDVPVFVLPHDQMSLLTGYNVTRGALAAMRRPAPADARSLLAGARRVAVLEGLVDVTNVGAIFRSAAALGVDAVLLAPTCADPLSRRAVRVSMGTVFLVPWARLDGPWPEGGLSELREAGFECAAMALSEDSVPLDAPALKDAPRLALLFGTEGDGLSHDAIAGCDEVVRIPMAHGVDSLNVAAASAVAFWELCRG